ncbi:helix-turn-helix domain-containing protein [Nocardioides hungaricus]
MSTLDDLVDEMAHLLDAPCTLEDPDFRLIGFSGQRSLADTVRQHSILERSSTDETRAWFHAQGIRESDGPIRTPGDADLGILSRLCVPARHLGRVQGYFWLLDPDESIDAALWPEAAAIAETAAALLGLAERRQARRDALYRDLVEGASQDARRSAVDLAAGAGIDLAEPVTCVVVERPQLTGQLASRPSRSGVVWARESGTVSAALVRSALVGPDLSADELLACLGLGNRDRGLDAETFIGLGPSVEGIDRATSSRSGALVALRVARAGGLRLATWSGLGPRALLGVARDDDLARTLVPERFAGFIRRASPDLVTTALVFLEEAGSAGRAADRLAVHRQTVYQRVAQIERLCACDLTSGADRLQLHLALLLAPYVLRAPSTP